MSEHSESMLAATTFGEERQRYLPNLHEAEDLFEEVRGYTEYETEREELHRTLVHVGNGVFEEGRVQLRSAGRTRLRIREGVTTALSFSRLAKSKREIDWKR